jgi:hypothetical protein
MVFDRSLAEFRRVFVHELFHFVWLRTGNAARREYCCESFCDSAAWLYSGIERHAEFTLPARSRRRRQAWFAKTVEVGPLSI